MNTLYQNYKEKRVKELTIVLLYNLENLKVLKMATLNVWIQGNVCNMYANIKNNFL